MIPQPRALLQPSHQIPSLLGSAVGGHGPSIALCAASADQISSYACCAAASCQEEAPVLQL